MPEGNAIGMLISVLAGAGFDKVAGGMNKMAQSGQDIASIFSLPNFPMLLAGAGIKDVANSMELVGPIMEGLQPPPEPEGPNPQHLAAAMQMLSANLGPGLSGIQSPAPGGGLSQFPMGL